MTVPAGTPLIEGKAAAQKDSTLSGGVVKGGGEQVFVPDADETLMKQEVVDLKDQTRNANDFNQIYDKLDNLTAGVTIK